MWNRQLRWRSTSSYGLLRDVIRVQATLASCLICSNCLNSMLSFHYIRNKNQFFHPPVSLKFKNQIIYSVNICRNIYKGVFRKDINFLKYLRTLKVIPISSIKALHSGLYIINHVRLASMYQGDYDGSGQQSCKCNYVDFSK